MPTKINDKLISWASDIDPGTIRQAEKAARLPIVEGHVALMPDAHIGIGATVGSVIPTKGAVIPAAVGVDIGCGMVAAELDVIDAQLPDTLEPLLARIEQVVPAGVGRGHDNVARAADRWLSAHSPATAFDFKTRVKAAKQFGTLGSGNHFLELCLDERGRVWVVLHSGSRGLGNQLAQMHISKARRLARDLHLRLEDPDLAYFLEGTPEFEAYIADMLWSQDYARANRDQMVDNAMREVFAFLGFGRETSIRSWPTRLTWSRSVTRCTRSSTTRAPDAADASDHVHGHEGVGGRPHRGVAVLNQPRAPVHRRVAGAPELRRRASIGTCGGRPAR